MLLAKHVLSGQVFAPVAAADKHLIMSVPQINNVVIDLSVLTGAGYVEAVQTVIDADVVADDRATIADVCRHMCVAVVANQHKSAGIVVAKIILKE